ncbi:MAG: recombinase-like helix-turn-helix domain-containing protein [Burkholderiales bacterium]
MAERGMTRAHMPTANTEGVVPDFNPYLEAYSRPRRNAHAGSGQIFGRSERDLIVWQTRPAVPSDYELGLAATLEQIFAQRIYALPDIVAALNREGVRTPDDAAWTEQNFQEAFRVLGRLAFGEVRDHG